MGGFDCFIDGFDLIRKPGLRQYFIVPTIINTIVLLALLSVSITSFDDWVTTIMGMFPEWMSFVYWLVWLVAFLVVFFIGLIVFNFIANLIASPFNAILSIKVEEHLRTRGPVEEVSMWLVLPRALGREVSKLLYVLPRMIGLLIITMIPVINVVSPVLWLLFGAWMMALQYTDYGADNNNVSIKELRTRLGSVRIQAIMFGLPAYFLLAIPILNLVLMPVGIAGGTRFWVEHLALD